MPLKQKQEIYNPNIRTYPMYRAEIVAAGMYVPEDKLKNDFFINSPNNPYKVYIGQDEQGDPIFAQDRVLLTEEKIIKTTGGIKERRRVDDKDTVEGLVRRAFLTTDFPAPKLDGILIGSISDEKRFPSVACRVQKALGAINVSYTEDVSAACSGFTHALDHARLQIQENGGYWLVAGVEILTRITDYEELNCDLFGDGCGLVVLGPTSDKKRGVLATQFRSDISGIDFIYKDKIGKLRMPAGPKVFQKATRGMIEIAHDLTRKTGIPENEVSRYVAHQANGNILNYIEEKVDPVKEGKIIRTIEEYGNMSAATVPVALAKSLREGRIKKDDLVTLVDMGAGLAFGGALIRI